MSMKNVDDLINNVTPREEVATPEPEQVAKEETTTENLPIETELVDAEEKLSYNEQFKKDKEESLARKSEKAEEKASNSEEKTENQTPKAEKEEELDEYGTKIPKSRTYTEEEVQKMIRERLARGRQAEPAPSPTPQQAQQAQQDGFSVDPNSSDSWEEQLNAFIDRRVETREQKLQQKAKEAEQQTWKQQEEQKQAEFEARFTTGMDNYPDFVEVIKGKPITNGILLAARSMKDPAAFVYAAAKQQPKELERISQITDPYQQAAEVGRLEERMKKARAVTKAPAPGGKTKGDFAPGSNPRSSIDDLIRHDAKRKLGRR